MAQTPTLQLTFEVSTPGRAPYRVTLRKTQNIIGRESGDIVLNDPEASALHAELDTTAGHVIVRDLGSSNGTWRDGERLPQFALYEKQSFHCGNTELTLLAIDGVDEALRPGQTAVGQTKVSSAPGPVHDTLIGSPGVAPAKPPPGWSPPSPVSLGTPAPVAETTHAAGDRALASPTLPGPHAPSSSPTAPGDIEPTVTRPAPSGPTLPGPAGTSLSSPTLPGPAGTTAMPGSTSTLPTTPQGSGSTVPASEPEAPPADPPEAETPSASVAAAAAAETVAESVVPTPDDAPQAKSGDAFRPPVANAVIKPEGEAEPSKPPPKTPRKPGGRGWGRLFAIAAGSAVGVSALVGVGYLIYTLFLGQPLAYATKVAETLPDSTVGFVAVRSVEDTVALLANEAIDADWKELRVDAMGFDPYDASAWSEQGIDPAAPVGLAMLEVQAPTLAVSLGVRDRDALQSMLSAQLPRLLAADPSKVSWTERSFGAVEGLWYEERGVAVLHHEGRSTVVFAPRPGHDDVVLAQAKALGETTAKNSLGSTEAFAALVPPPGEHVGLAYVHGASLRDALPLSGDAFVARLALADVDGVGVLLTHEPDAVHLSTEVVVRSGSRPLEVLGNAKRKGSALARLGGPVLAAFDMQLDGGAIDRALGGALTALGQSLSVVESDTTEALGIDLRAEVTQNLSGAFGAALLALPPSKDETHALQAVAWVGVTDEAAAAKTLGRAYEKAVSQLNLDTQQRAEGDIQIYLVPEDPDRQRPRFQAFVHGGHLWTLVGPVDPAMIIKGPSKPFPADVRHRSVADAMAKGDAAAAFTDVRALLEALGPLLSERERNDLAQASAVTDLIETSTLRTRRDGRVVVLRHSLHTTQDAGLQGLLRATTSRVGEAMSTKLAHASRAARCHAVSNHVLELSRKSLKAKNAPLEVGWDIQRGVQEECSKPTMTTARLDCYLEADSTEALSACDAKHPPLEVPDTPDAPPPTVDPLKPEQGEPKPVPYVDDIWPHRVDDPDSDSPQPDVNYAVPLGESPNMRGATDALVTIVMFGDFECPHCRAVTSTLDEVLARHGDDVRLVYRHLPLENIHPSARAAAKAALAAGEQDAFWAMHDRLYERGNRLDDDVIEASARKAGVDMKRYGRDLASAAIEARLQRDIDLAAKLGVRGTPAFFVNGRYLGGRQTAAAFNTVIAEELTRARTFVERRGNTRKRLYEDMLEHFAPEVVQPETAIALPAGDGKRYIVSTEGLPRKGASTFAQVEIIECGDFDCPFCARSRKALQETLDDYPGVALYFAHNPLAYHPGAEPAARAAQAAHAQGKFWEMHDELFKDQRSKARSDADYKRYAARLGLDVAQFERDYGSDETADAVATQKKLCTDNEATATPTFFINGRRVAGAQSTEQFKALVESELSEGI